MLTRAASKPILLGRNSRHIHVKVPFAQSQRNDDEEPTTSSSAKEQAQIEAFRRKMMRGEKKRVRGVPIVRA
jgi:hypothetical protein